VLNGDLEEIEAQLEQGADIDAAENQKGWTSIIALALRTILNHSKPWLLMGGKHVVAPAKDTKGGRQQK
jgi:hypothetical protein